MLSIPPTAMVVRTLARIKSYPSIIAFMPDPQTLLSVVAPTE